MEKPEPMSLAARIASGLACLAGAVFLNVRGYQMLGFMAEVMSVGFLIPRRRCP